MTVVQGCKNEVAHSRCTTKNFYCRNVFFLHFILYARSHQRGVRGHRVARMDHVSCPQACPKNNISMIIVFTLRNLNTKITEGNSAKLLFHNFVSN